MLATAVARRSAARARRAARASVADSPGEDDDRLSMVLAAARPLILLSPAKSLNFDKKLSAALFAAASTQPQYLETANGLVDTLAALTKGEIKSLMSLSDALATLNHGRFTGFDAQPARVALGAFEGQAYKGIDAASLASAELDYLQGSLRILCGLYGVVRPLDEIRPYRLEMSTRLKHAGHANLYELWRETLTDHVNAELDAMGDGAAKFVLNAASQEYAKAVALDRLRAPVVTASFPGPAVHAKTARGELARFCAQQRVSSVEQLRAFRGSRGEWSLLPAESTATLLVFKRGAPSGGGAAPAKALGGGGGAAAADGDEAGGGSAKGRGRKRGRAA